MEVASESDTGWMARGRESGGSQATTPSYPWTGPSVCLRLVPGPGRLWRALRKHRQGMSLWEWGRQACWPDSAQPPTSRSTLGRNVGPPSPLTPAAAGAQPHPSRGAPLPGPKEPEPLEVMRAQRVGSHILLAGQQPGRRTRGGALSPFLRRGYCKCHQGGWATRPGSRFLSASKAWSLRCRRPRVGSGPPRHTGSPG